MKASISIVSALQIIVLLIATIIGHQSAEVVAKKMTTKKKQHVLFLGASQTSHILHMQGLAEEMAHRGYKVTFAALESDKKFISKADNGIEFLSVRVYYLFMLVCCNIITFSNFQYILELSLRPENLNTTPHIMDIHMIYSIYFVSVQIIQSIFTNHYYLNFLLITIPQLI